MIPEQERKQIIDLVNREVVPAIGCTEPIAVALCTARAAECLGCRPARIAVRLSANILKNAMGVGIPGTGMIGLPIAVALGATIGRSEYRLEVLRDVTPEAVADARRMIDEKRICIALKEDIDEKLYIEVEVEADAEMAAAAASDGASGTGNGNEFPAEPIVGNTGPCAGTGCNASADPAGSGSAAGSSTQSAAGTVPDSSAESAAGNSEFHAGTVSPARRAVAVIAGGHTSFVYLARDGEVLLDKRCAAAGEAEEGGVPLTLRRVWEFAMTTPLDELRFILEARRLNKAAAERSFAGEFGHCVGRTLRCERERTVMGDSIFSRILSYTSAACDARMAGAMIPVMSNSGSGNQGIAATLPVVVYAEQTGASEERTIRALVLSHLTVIYIKQSLGRLSALCGCVVAATGSSCGITYLMGGGYEQVVAAVKNMIANLTGMICDGAKPSCSMKLTSGVSTAVVSAMMAMDGHCVSSVEGIIDEDVDKCIRNLTAIGRDGMTETDRLVLGIMTHKC